MSTKPSELPFAIPQFLGLHLFVYLSPFSSSTLSLMLSCFSLSSAFCCCSHMFEYTPPSEISSSCLSRTKRGDVWHHEKFSLKYARPAIWVNLSVKVNSCLADNPLIRTPTIWTEVTYRPKLQQKVADTSGCSKLTLTFRVLISLQPTTRMYLMT